MKGELANLDATEQAELVRRKEVSPLELVDAAITRIEKVNPQLNAVITPLFDKARAQAQLGPAWRFLSGDTPYLVSGAQSPKPAPALVGALCPVTRTFPSARSTNHTSPAGGHLLTRANLRRSRVRESRPLGSVRAKAEWLSYST